MKIEIDQGFIELVDQLGTDLTVVNAARVSFGNKKTEFEEKDCKLINFLAEHRHTSPFRHCILQFHVKAPEFVGRQWYKHIIGSDYTFKDQAWNEISGRYVNVKEEFWKPTDFRMQSSNNKQASIRDSQITNNKEMIKLYNETVENNYKIYKILLENEVCKEQARTILPVNFYTEWYWTASLQTVAHFISLRNKPEAQVEIREYAEGIEKIVKNTFPNAWKALNEHL